MLFLVIISWKVVSCFNEAGGGCFSDRGRLHFKWGGTPWGGIGFGGEVFEKNCKNGGYPPTIGNPVITFSLLS